MTTTTEMSEIFNVDELLQRIKNHLMQKSLLSPISKNDDKSNAEKKLCAIQINSALLQDKTLREAIAREFDIQIIAKIMNTLDLVLVTTQCANVVEFDNIWLDLNVDDSNEITQFEFVVSYTLKS